MTGTIMDLALLPPVLRFFIGLALIPTVVVGAALFLHWIGKGEEEGE